MKKETARTQAHWENVYQSKSPAEVSWYQEHSLQSLEFIRRTGVAKSAQIIDVGGGASRLVDDLLANRFKHVTVLDISPAALKAAQDRLGDLAAEVTWLPADITRTQLRSQSYEVWHDRAVFHFLTQPEDRARYVNAVQQAVQPGGHVIVATFAPDGPSRCSGLDVRRYDPQSLHSEFGDDFKLIDHARETHMTPMGKEQRFIYCYCRIRPSSSA